MLKKNAGLIIFLIAMFFAVFIPYLLFTEEKVNEREQVSIIMNFVSGHEKCSTYSLPKNRSGFHVSSSRGSYSLSYAVPSISGLTKLGQTLKNGVIDYKIVESCEDN